MDIVRQFLIITAVFTLGHLQTSQAAKFDCNTFATHICLDFKCQFERFTDSNRRLDLIEKLADRYLDEVTKRSDYRGQHSILIETLFKEESETLKFLSQPEKDYLKALIDKTEFRNSKKVDVTQSPVLYKQLGVPSIKDQVKSATLASKHQIISHYEILGGSGQLRAHPRYNHEFGALTELVFEGKNGKLTKYPIPPSENITSVKFLSEVPGAGFLMIAKSNGIEKAYSISSSPNKKPKKLLGNSKIQTYGDSPVNMVFSTDASSLSPDKLFFVMKPGTNDHFTFEQIKIPPDAWTLNMEFQAELLPSELPDRPLFFSSSTSNFYWLSDEGILKILPSPVAAPGPQAKAIKISNDKFLLSMMHGNPKNLSTRTKLGHSLNVVYEVPPPNGSVDILLDIKKQTATHLTVPSDNKTYYRFDEKVIPLPSGDQLLLLARTTIYDNNTVWITSHEWILLSKNGTRLEVVVQAAPPDAEVVSRDGDVLLYQFHQGDSRGSEIEGLLVNPYTGQKTPISFPKNLVPFKEGKFVGPHGIYQINAATESLEHKLRADISKFRVAILNDNTRLLIADLAKYNRTGIYLSRKFETPENGAFKQLTLLPTRNSWILTESEFDDYENGRGMLILSGKSSGPQNNEVTNDIFEVDLNAGTMNLVLTQTKKLEDSPVANTQWNILPKTGIVFGVKDRRLQVYKFDNDGNQITIDIPGIDKDTIIFEAFATLKDEQSFLHLATDQGIQIVTFDSL